jgi:hypothetical protein
MRSLVQSLLVFVLCATAASAHAGLFSKKTRPAESEQYDTGFEAWLHATGQRLALSPNNEIAWAGAIFVASNSNAAEVAPEPAPPTTGAGRLLRHIYYEGTERRAESLAQWIAAEPDNVFVLALAIHDGDAVLAEQARARLPFATRYDDYYLALQNLSGEIEKHFDVTPPTKPAGYKMPSWTFLTDMTVAAHLHMFATLATDVPDQSLDDIVSDPARALALADRLIAATGSVSAAGAGARLGLKVAPGPADRERYCRIEARAQAQEDALSWLLTEAESVDQRRHFHELLRTRNIVDAIDAMAAQLPEEQRPEPLDEQRLAQCIDGHPPSEDSD